MSAEARRRILEAQAFFSLPGAAAVEKDLQVVRAIRAIAAVEAAPFSLVFGGGTALARAHRLIERMSEDIDFKIVAPPGHEAQSGEALKRELRLLRRRVSSSLLNAGFVFDEEDESHVRARNRGRYTVYQLPYSGEFALGEGLRATIQVELTLAPLLLPPVELPVSSFVAEAFKEPPEAPRMSCVSVMETAAEKLVALTRRTAMEAAGLGAEKDATLVRHLYDLQCLRPLLNAEMMGFSVMAVMERDTREFGNQFPAYRTDPAGESCKAVEVLASNPVYAERYAAFTRDMVYGAVPEFEACLAAVSELLEAAKR